MWNIQEKGNTEIWTSDICRLKIDVINDRCKIYVDYKGHNVLVPMGIWEFEEEVNTRRIKYEVEGEKGNLKSLCYVIEKEDKRLFSDLIYFFLKENNLDETLNPALKFQI